MQFLLTAYDGEGKLEKRLEVRPQHLANLPKDHVICAGGLLTEEGQMKGSAMVMEFENGAALDEYLRTEPYVVAGVWEKITVEPMNVVIAKEAS
ncbi:MAG: hypothetical protein IJG30_00790 [Synergistaceae bacterium]|nr:hypothetical protein [Synergistaceae bacterium]